MDSVRDSLNRPWVLDLDATIKPLYGHQEGAEIGYNPRKPGRPSHVLHTFWIGNLRLVHTGHHDEAERIHLQSIAPDAQDQSGAYGNFYLALSLNRLMQGKPDDARAAQDAAPAFPRLQGVPDEQADWQTQLITVMRAWIHLDQRDYRRQALARQARLAQRGGADPFTVGVEGQIMFWHPTEPLQCCSSNAQGSKWHRSQCMPHLLSSLAV